MTDIRRQWRKILRIGRLPARTNGKQRAPVERIFKRHNAALMATVAVVGEFTRQFQCRFVGFRAGVTKEDAIGKSGVDQFFRQSQYRLVGVTITGMPELTRLFVQRLTQFRVRMAQCVHRNATREVDILFPLLIPQARTFATYRNKWCRSVNR